MSKVDQNPEHDGMTEEEIAGLAELEAQLKDDDADEEFNPEAVHKEEEQQEEQQALTPEEEQAKADADAKAQADEEARAKADADAAAAEAAKKPEQQERSTQAPYLVVEAPDDAEAKLAGITTKKVDLSKQFDDGDLTTAEYQTELDKLNREERAIERQVDRAQLAAELEEQRAVNERTEAIGTFLQGVEIPFDPKNLRFQALDAAVRIVASEEANAQLTYAEVMKKAYDLCITEGTLQAKQSPAQVQGKQQQQPAKQAPKPIDAPPSLARMPAAESTDTGENRFAWLASIRDPDKHEQAFAKLSAADQEAYLATGG